MLQEKIRGKSSLMSLLFIAMIVLMCGFRVGYGQDSSGNQSKAEQKTAAINNEKAKAAETELKHELEPVEVIVTASRRETALQDASQSVTVITEKDIKNSSATKLDEFLKNELGVDFKGSYLARTYEVSPIAMRGVGPGWGRVLILVDGIPSQDSAQGFARENIIPLSDIGRIEIIRGPSSALYGSKAMGGVINIITKQPTERSETHFNGSYGSLDTHNEEFLQMGKLGKGFSYSFSANNFGTDGYIPEEIEQPYMSKIYKDEDVINGKVTWDINQNQSLTVGAKHLREEYGGGVKYANSRRHTSGTWIDYKGLHIGPFDLRAQAYYDTELFFGNESTSTVNFAALEAKRQCDYVETGGTFSASVHLAKWNVFTTGFDLRKDVFLTERNYVTTVRQQRTGGRIMNLSGFWQDEMYFFDNRLIATVGIRYDWVKGYSGRVIDTKPTAPGLPYATFYPDHTEDKSSPKFGLTYHLDQNTTLRGSIGEAFRFPAITSLYHTTMHPGFTFLGNPNLKPETLVAYDAGVERKFGRKLIGTVTVYKSHAKDYLAYLITSAGPPAIMTVENITSVNIHGVESELRYNLKDYFSISGDYTYNSSEIDKNPSNKTLEGQDLAYSPRHKYGMVFAYNNPAILSVMLAFHYESKSYADNRKELNEHSVWDIKLARKLTNFVSVEVNLENLFDKEYQVDHISTGSYLLAPGRLVTAGLKFAF